MRKLLFLAPAQRFGDFALLLLRIFVGLFLVWGVWDNVSSSERMQEFAQFLGQHGFPSPRLLAPFSVYLQLLIGVAFVLPGGERHESRTVSSARQAIPSLPRIVRLGAVRSLGTTPDITVSRLAPPSALTIEPEVVVLTCPDGSIELECAGGAAPETPQYPEYELDLVSRQGSTLAWRSARQLPTSGSVLSFTLNEPEALAAGDYDVIVRGHSPEHEEVVARFWLRVE